MIKMVAQFFLKIQLNLTNENIIFIHPLELGASTFSFGERK